MGILNVTPDSFSDGGAYFSVEQAVAQGMKLIEQGADVLDIGGESTRPGSDPVSEDEQIRRVVPVIEKLAREIHIPVSIDTAGAKVAQAALEAGASIINDISALRFDPKMASLAAEKSVPVVLMHMQGTPRTMQEAPSYENVVLEVKEFLRRRIEFAMSAGIDRKKIIVDPGIGFGKRFEDNLAILSQIEDFFDLDCPVLVGHSRKGFIGKLTGRPVNERDSGTLVISTLLAQKKVHLLRTHEVEATRQACQIVDQLIRRVHPPS